jgi:ABC-type branched-subunit amino acid transport system ATPase component
MSRRTKRSGTAWVFWQQAETALDEARNLMQQAATIVANEQVIPLPPILVRSIRRDISHFQEKFSVLVREQKQKAVR